MAGEGFTFDWQSVERISRVVSEFESQPIDGKLPTIDGKPAGTYHAWCKVLSSAGTAGVYNAVRAQVDSGATPWSYDAQVLVKEVNGKTLTVGSFYYCHLLWFTTNSKPVYGVQATASTTISTTSKTVVTDVTCSGGTLVVTKDTILTVSSSSGSGSG